MEKPLPPVAEGQSLYLTHQPENGYKRLKIKPVEFTLLLSAQTIAILLPAVTMTRSNYGICKMDKHFPH
jgi:hypothetical protein